jgi:hypothetical protein
LDKLFSTKIGGLFSKSLAAQTDTASAGTGGYATASSNGGAVAVGDINSGGNAGNAVGVGDTYGSVWVDGGNVSNSTSVGITADGGTAIADASGGSYNVAFVS